MRYRGLRWRTGGSGSIVQRLLGKYRNVQPSPVPIRQAKALGGSNISRLRCGVGLHLVSNGIYMLVQGSLAIVSRLAYEIQLRRKYLPRREKDMDDAMVGKRWMWVCRILESLATVSEYLYSRSRWATLLVAVHEYLVRRCQLR